MSLAVERPFREWNPDQYLLLPPRLRDELGEGDLACFIVELRDALDFTSVLRVYTGDRGQPAYHPVMMTLLLMYGYARGITSSREMERRCRMDLGFRLVAGGEKPDHDTIAEFRRRHLGAFKGLFLQTVQLAQGVGMVKLGHLSVDGTKMLAAASKHKAMSYGRMDEAMARLDRQVEALLAEAERIDAEEDRKYGKGKRGDELPEALRDPKERKRRMEQVARRLREEREAERLRQLAEEKQKRKEAIAEAKETLEKEARARAAAEGKPVEEARPEEKAQRNFTDPESRIMPKNKREFVQAYNAQAVVDAGSQIIVAEEVTQQTNDKNLFSPMVEQAVANTGATPHQISADSGYLAEADVKKVEALGTEAFVATERQRHGDRPPPPRGRPPEGLTWVERMARKLSTKKGRATYAKRKVTVEPVFGQIKEERRFRRFSMRGLAKVGCEWSLVCAVHNLVKLFRCWCALAPAAA